MFGLMTMATTSPKGQICRSYIYLKGDMVNLKNVKRALEELAVQYGFTKPFYILANAQGPAYNRTFYVICTLIDHKRNKTFIGHSN